jgi:hypothetical protein
MCVNCGRQGNAIFAVVFGVCKSDNSRCEGILGIV